MSTLSLSELEAGAGREKKGEPVILPPLNPDFRSFWILGYRMCGPLGIVFSVGIVYYFLYLGWNADEGSDM